MDVAKIVSDAANWTRNEQIWDIASWESRRSTPRMHSLNLTCQLECFLLLPGCHVEGNGRLSHNKVEATVKNAVSVSGCAGLRLWTFGGCKMDCFEVMNFWRLKNGYFEVINLWWFRKWIFLNHRVMFHLKSWKSSETLVSKQNLLVNFKLQP